MNAGPFARLLIVDDEWPQMKALCDTLTIEGFFTTGYTSPQHALAALRDQEFDLLLTDLMMPEIDGITLLAAAREISPDIVAIVMTGHAAIDTAVEAMQAGALDYIVKPFRLQVVLPVLERALSMRRLRLEKIGFIFQTHNLLPFLDSTDNVAIVLDLARFDSATARARAIELLDYLQVGHRKHAMPANLSGGEAQRVAIARALAEVRLLDPGPIRSVPELSWICSAKSRSIRMLPSLP